MTDTLLIRALEKFIAKRDAGYPTGELITANTGNVFYEWQPAILAYFDPWGDFARASAGVVGRKFLEHDADAQTASALLQVIRSGVLGDLPPNHPMFLAYMRMTAERDILLFQSRSAQSGM